MFGLSIEMSLVSLLCLLVNAVFEFIIVRNKRIPSGRADNKSGIMHNQTEVRDIKSIYG